jgi:hypothetical protein
MIRISKECIVEKGKQNPALKKASNSFLASYLETHPHPQSLVSLEYLRHIKSFLFDSLEPEMAFFLLPILVLGEEEKLKTILDQCLFKHDGSSSELAKSCQLL